MDQMFGLWLKLKPTKKVDLRDISPDGSQSMMDHDLIPANALKR
jgi:hypothetical protein